MKYGYSRTKEAPDGDPDDYVSIDSGRIYIRSEYIPSIEWSHGCTWSTDRVINLVPEYTLHTF